MRMFGMPRTEGKWPCSPCRSFCILFAAVVAGCFHIGQTTAQHAQFSEKNTDRPGFDYTMFSLDLAGLSTAEDVCRDACARDVRCKAWTVVAVGVHGPEARCWLKSGIPGARSNVCCTSGVPIRELEPNVDRPGGDYSTFE